MMTKLMKQSRPSLRHEILTRHPPFNVGAPRWRNKIVKTPGPGQYHSEKPIRARFVEDWSFKSEVENFSKHLGYRNADVLIQRQKEREANGPGTHDIPTSLTGINPDKGVSFTKANRFAKDGSYNTPGPAHINLQPKLGVPYKPDFNTPPAYVGWLVGAPRFDKTAHFPAHHIGPGRYDPKDLGSFEEVVKRYVSKRGPYDLMTGPRDETTLIGYYKPPNQAGKDIAFVNLPGEMSRLSHPKNANVGKWWPGIPRLEQRMTNRMVLTDLSMCYKDPDQPGPGFYEIKGGIVKAKPNKVPFLQGTPWARPFVPRTIYPGPGRYEDETRKQYFSRIRGNGHRYQFISKTPRETKPPPTFNSF